MNIKLNGNDTRIEENCTVQQLITELNLGDERIAVEVNTTIVPRSQFTAHQLQKNDCVEIINAVGGG